MRLKHAVLATFSILVLALGTARAGAPVHSLSFSGYDWNVKDSGAETMGPGKNYFSASDDNVHLDEQGRLHLRVTQGPKGWVCAEIWLKQPLGYGTYTLETESPLADLDPNIVFGLFTWSNDPAAYHQELDIEFSRWAQPADPLNAQFAVQPTPARGPAGNLHRWRLDDSASSAGTFSMSWTPGHVDFSATSGPGRSATWSYPNRAGVPAASDGTIHLNLWLYHGLAPVYGEPTEVVVKKFTFTPAAG